jgi:hypothetical protein
MTPTSSPQTTEVVSIVDKLFSADERTALAGFLPGACLRRRCTLLSAALDAGGGPALFPQRDRHEFDEADH